MKKFVLLLAVLLFLWSCKSSESSQVAHTPTIPTTSNDTEVLLPEPEEDDYFSLTDEQKVVKVLDLGQFNQGKALELALTINPKNLGKQGKYLYRKIEKEYMLIKSGKDKLGDAHTNISAMAIDHEDLWIGDWQGGLSRYSLPTEDLEVVRKTRPSARVQSINAILVEEEEVWASASDAVICYNKRTSNSEIITLPTKSYAWDVVRYQNKLIIATQGSGLYALNQDRQFSQVVFNDRRIKFVNRLAVIDDMLFAGTDNGLWFYNGEEWHSITELTGLNVLSLKVNSNSLYIGTNQDLYALEIDGSIKKFNLKQDYIQSLTIMGNTLIAGSLENGIACIDMLKKSVENEELSSKSPILLRVGSLVSYHPYLVVGTMGNSVVLVHQQLFKKQ